MTWTCACGLKVPEGVWHECSALGWRDGRMCRECGMWVAPETSHVCGPRSENTRVPVEALTRLQTLLQQAVRLLEEIIR